MKAESPTDIRSAFFEQIQINNKSINIPESILVIYDNAPYIGDAYMFFMDFVYLREIAGHLLIAVTNQKSYEVLLQIVRHHPVEDAIKHLELDTLDFNQFDSVFIIENSDVSESRVLKELALRFTEGAPADRPSFSLHYLSFSRIIEKMPFLQFRHFSEAVHLYECQPKPEAILLTPEELQWGKQWLNSHGVLTNERIIIFLSSTSAFEKMISRTVYYEMLEWMIGHEDVKVLLFDEQRTGKKQFIEEEIGHEKIHKVIVAEGLTIRESMILMASSYIAGIIGPCTGLMHLADGIYKFLLGHQLIKAEEIPLLLTYVGLNHDRNYNPHSWWSGSIVNCFAIQRNQAGEKVLVPLEECDHDTRAFQAKCLPTCEISSQLLINLISDE